MNSVRVQSIGAHMSGNVYAWDVVSEAADDTWGGKIGWDFFVEVFKWARQADPKPRYAPDLSGAGWRKSFHRSVEVDCCC